jgi:pyruvate dehydrogenase E2 component (dihydrolipoamide acetyltransferase)
MTEITMPKLSDTMTEGRFGAWKKSLGDRVERGEIIAEVETDKAVMELEAYASGILLETLIKAGELVAVGTVIGVIGAEGEVAVAHPVPPMVVVDSPPVPFIPSVAQEVVPAISDAGSAPTSHREEHHDGRAAPAVRRHARELGIDLTLVPGSGPGGRVLMEDLERYRKGAVPAEPEPVSLGEPISEAESSVLPVSPAAVSGEGQALSRMRVAIARTVTESWQTIPHFSVTVDVTMDAAEEIRRELKQSGTALSVNDFILKAAALALRKYPRANSSFSNNKIITHEAVNIGSAVSLPDGLLVPVIRGCDNLSLREIAAESRRLVTATRDGRLSEAEMTGGTFSISNLGRYGITSFAAVILPPQAAILAVGAVREAVVPRKGMPYLAQVLTLTLSADHRLLDGAYAAEFLTQVRTLLETPVLLLG